MNSKMLKKLLSLLTAFALMFSMVPAMGIAASAEAENLLANGDFETTGTWVDGNGTEIGQQQEVPVTTNVYTNDFSGASPLFAWNVNNTSSSVVDLNGDSVLSFTPGTNTYVTYYGMSSLVVGDDYILKCKVYTDTDTSFRLYDNATGKNMHKTATAGQWTEYTVSLTATAAATTLYFGVMDGSGNTVYIDDVSIAHVEKETVAVPVYSNDFSGTSPTLDWNITNTTSSVVDLDGNKVLSFAPGTNTYITYYGMKSLVVGNKYVMSCKIYCDTNVYFRLLDDVSKQYAIKTALAGQWTEYTFDVTATATNAMLYFGIMDSNAGPVYIDDVCIASYEVQNATSYSDGIGNCNGAEDSSVLAMSANAQVSQPVALSAGNTYGYSFDVKGDSTAALSLLNGDAITVSEDWTTVTGCFVADSDDTSFGFACTAGAVLLDNVSVWQAGAPIDISLGLNQVTGDGTWQFSVASDSEIPTGYYKLPVIADGVEIEVPIQYNGNIMLIYPNMFEGVFGGFIPTSSFVIAENTVLKKLNTTGWVEVEGAEPLTITEALDLSCVDGVWGITVVNHDIDVEYQFAHADGTWQLNADTSMADSTYYKVQATVDGVAQNVKLHRTDTGFIIYPSFFANGTAPVTSLEIDSGAVMKAIDNNDNWNEIAGAATLTVTDALKVENIDGTWVDMTQYADVTFTELSASDLSVYKWEDQSESQYRSVFAIEALNGIAIGNSGWANFTKVAGKVLVDDVAVGVVFGMVPTSDGWGKDSAFLLYITGDGYRDAATTASKIAICEGTTIISPVDTTKGFKFTEDFCMYKNCDGSWDTTADTHVWAENTEAEGALVSGANCQSAGVYYYSCACGELSSETFTSGELGDHSYVNGDCQYCDATAQEITLSLQTVTSDTWQLKPSAAPANSYYKATVMIDGSEYDILMQYGSNLMLVYNNFFTALGGKVPTQSLVIPAGTVLTPMVLDNGWKEIDGATAVVVAEELEITNIAGKWVEMSKYADVNFTEVYAADLDVYYQNIMRLGDYSAAEIAIAKLQHPEIADLIEIYGDDANMTTFGIKSVNENLLIPNDASWATFQLLGTISVVGATAAETYVLQTPVSGTEDSETAMDNAFLVRFYNGFIADNATSVTIEPGTRIVTKDGTAGFVFVDGYTIYRDSDGNWSDVAPAGTNPVKKWGLTLGDQIGVNFEVNAGMNVSFAVNGNAVDAVQSGNTYTIYLAAAQMNDVITVSVDGVAQEKTYSVRGYAEIILNDGGYGELTNNLVKAMLVYGGAAQTYFGYNTGNLANAGIDVEASVPTGNAGLNVTGSVSGIKYYGATLVHENKTAVRLYFKADSIEGIETELTQSGNLYYVEIDGINPQNLDEAVKAVISNGTESMTVTYSPMDYILRMYQKGSANTQALVQALYGYYVAAEAYVG